MIPKISGSGSSFKGLSDYLMHDPKAQTSERVAWTHTHNLANDYVPAAVNEMYVTAESAEWLKQQAGVHAGGRPTENPVKHVSLNWAESDKPSREHMIATGESYLRHMGWSEHQVIMMAHQDKSYAHLHMIINAIHPETGKALDDGFERRRSQEWALRYELEQNRVHCTERLKNVRDREQSMPRNIAMEFKGKEQEFSRAERKMPENASEIPEYSLENRHKAEWEIFKDIQRAERVQFFAEGKIEFRQLKNAIYREVREEFRERWAEYYEARKNSTDANCEQLASLKEKIVADQKAALEPRRDAACAELMEKREQEKETLYAEQRAMRAEFRGRLESGIDNSDFFAGLLEKREKAAATRQAFRQAGYETTSRSLDPVETPFFGKVIDTRLQPILHEPWRQEALQGHARQKDVANLMVGRGKVGVGAMLDGAFSFLTNLGSAQPEPMSQEQRADLFREAAENATKQQQHAAREEEDLAWRERQKDFFRE